MVFTILTYLVRGAGHPLTLLLVPLLGVTSPLLLGLVDLYLRKTIG